MDFCKKLSITSLVCICLFSVNSALAKDKITVDKSIPYASTSNAPDAVMKDCKLGESTIKYLGKYSKITQVGKIPTSGKYLEMEITQVFAPGGGAWSGPKWFEITGKLKEGEKSIGSFRAKRATGGGAFGGFKGTCSMLQRCAKALGKDISKWLKNPVEDAKLGDAR